MKSHYHPPHCRSALCISDEWIKCIACDIVKRAEQKVLRELQQDRDSRQP